MTVVIAGERSGVGKTTITLSILTTMISFQEKIQSFKVGPDYIDPMYHTAITNLPCRNLDPILTSESYVKECFYRYANKYSLIEGVMGLFDGLSGINDLGSTAHIAKLLNLPIVLVVSCKSISRSVAAIVHGYNSFDPMIKIKGIILNYISSERHLEILEQSISSLNIPIIGRFWRDDQIKIPDRYLGLLPTDEFNLTKLFDYLIDIGKRCLDWNLLLPLLISPKYNYEQSATIPKIKLAVAKDKAFNFYYADNFDLLNQSGIEIVFFSPLQDKYIPNDISGLFLGGGFPELFAEELSSNLNLINQLKYLIRSGLPTYAECGGLMYLCQGITTADLKSFPMVNILPTKSIMTSKLTLGYRVATVKYGSFLCRKSEKIVGHEFHRSVLSNCSNYPLFNLEYFNSNLANYDEGWSLLNVHASYLHLHLGGKENLLKRLVKKCYKYQNKVGNFP